MFSQSRSDRPSPTSSTSLTLLIAHPHTIVRDALTGWARNISGVSLVGDTSTLAAAVEIARSSTPHCVLIDGALLADNQSDLATLAGITKVISLGGSSQNAKVQVIPTEATQNDFIKALEKTFEGSVLTVEKSVVPADAEALALLSKREREVFFLLADGVPNRIIAKQLFVSPRTVETHRARVIKKLGLSSTAGLIKYAIRHQLLAP